MRLPLTPPVSDLSGLEMDSTSLAPMRRKILIVDDNQDAAESLSILLGLEGHEVRVAHLGKTAISIAQSFRPDVALLDIGLPDITGYDVAQKLRVEPWANSIQLIALTGWGQDHDRRRALDSGFDHHMSKPVDPEQLKCLVGSNYP